MGISLQELQNRMGYRFANEEYLRRAMTHSSYANETGNPRHHLLCNERLEFLGDSVLSLITSDFLYRQYPELPEGDLTRMRAALVREEALASYARKLGLGEFLMLGKGERNSGGADKDAVIADAFEATLAAIYLDAGALNGLDAVAKFLLPFIKEAADLIPQSGGYHDDYKSRLQEFVQKDGGELEYRIVSESGPDHNKTFSVEVYLDSNRIGTGSGHSKKNAEQAAAHDAMKLFALKS
ncbi:MAG: ribonuclease III [Clostridia bacterium]|nr:ribonuclease III [Clostridia bacterium]